MVDAAGPEQAPFIADCWKAMMDELDMAPGGLIADWRGRLSSYFASGIAAGSQGWFVARTGDGTLFGCAGVLIGETALVYVRPWATLAGVFVRPEYRRRGTARALTEAAIGWARRRGCGALRLIASEQAEGLYRTLGFTDGRELVLRLRP